jgi:hypothetical protein
VLVDPEPDKNAENADRAQSGEEHEPLTTGLRHGTLGYRSPAGLRAAACRV